MIFRVEAQDGQAGGGVCLCVLTCIRGRRGFTYIRVEGTHGEPRVPSQESPNMYESLDLGISPMSLIVHNSIHEWFLTPVPSAVSPVK